MGFLKRNIISFITLIAFILVLILYSIERIEFNLFIGSLGTIVTIYFGLIRFQIENDKIFKELFTSFNGKYDEKFNDLINELKTDPDKTLEQGEINLIIDYFNLCAEEYLWFSKGRIPKSVWRAWKSGIIENLKIKQVMDVFEVETSTKEGEISFYGLVEELGKRV
ncbi:hypothetical protein [Algoriphagus machipongonensis]|uniref:Uncharacterized protein n=1 Tax=Algoriphagus machipongonensis TaxID=388413 RepID=A3HT84_9BACT|nr:hypothetical protein [Algoriphagus machipongonensis]EAZ83052.1 hypothetical protein ALPR1_12565 [Algoriphagus machipongonensis]